VPWLFKLATIVSVAGKGGVYTTYNFWREYEMVSVHGFRLTERIEFATNHLDHDISSNAIPFSNRCFVETLQKCLSLQTKLYRKDLNGSNHNDFGCWEMYTSGMCTVDGQY
jgi:hypothetical protein